MIASQLDNVQHLLKKFNLGLYTVEKRNLMFRFYIAFLNKCRGQNIQFGATNVLFKIFKSSGNLWQNIFTRPLLPQSRLANVKYKTRMTKSRLATTLILGQGGKKGKWYKKSLVKCNWQRFLSKIGSLDRINLGQ